MNATLVGFIFYLAATLAIGALTYGVAKNQSDFLLAGRRLNVWVATLSERASGESAWLLLGLPGVTFATGWIKTWDALGCVLGITASWVLIARKLRVDTEHENALTIPEYLAKKFGLYARPIRIVASIVILFFYAVYIAAQFKGAGDTLFITFGLDRSFGMLLGAGVIIAYTMAGGFLAVAWTDFVQGLLMLATLIVLPWVGALEIMNRTDPGLWPTETGSLTAGASGFSVVALIVSGLSWGLGYFGQPHTLTRFMAINDPKKVRVGQWVAVTWAILGFGGALAIGIVGIYIFPQGTFTSNDQLMPALANELLPAWLAGIFISGAVAAMMSTADSQLLVGTSTIAEDLVHKTWGIEVSAERMVSVSRATAITLGLVALLLAFQSQDTLIFDLVSYAWGGLGAAFGPVILLTLYWPRLTGPGVLAGMLTGGITTVIWSNITFLEASLSARASAFLLALFAAMLTSMCAPPSKTTGLEPRNSTA